MISSKQRTGLTIVIIAGAILTIILGCWLYYWINYAHPLDVFRTQEIESIQHFDALNMTTLSELPVPLEGMKLVSKGTGGILSPTNVHGRRLRLKYTIDPNSTLTTVDLLEHYRETLIPKGWNESRSWFGDEGSLYIRDTACIEIIVLYQAQEYDIDIWHDFLSQEFSPSLPPSKLLYYHDMGKTDVLTCPYR